MHISSYECAKCKLVTVYGLSAVESLNDVFFSSKTQELCIVSDGSTGQPKTEERLMEEVARCSDYIESNCQRLTGEIPGV